jgi:hypothetical protein
MKDHQIWTFAKSDDSGHFAVVYREYEHWNGYVVHKNVDLTTYENFDGFSSAVNFIGLASRFETLEEAKNSVDPEATLNSELRSD